MKAIRYLLPLLMALCCSACQAVPQLSPPVDQPQPDAPAAASAAWQSQTEPVTLTLSTGSPQQGNDHPWGSDGISQAITQLTGVTLACQSQPQLEVLLSSGELGDLVYAYYDEINLRKLENADVSLALDELSAQHCLTFGPALTRWRSSTTNALTAMYIPSAGDISARRSMRTTGSPSPCPGC